MAPADAPVDDDGSECAICQERMCDVRTACGHEFCRACMLTVSAITTACPYCRMPISLYTIRDMATGAPLREPPTTIDGSTYVHRLRGHERPRDLRGYASYHFLGDESYISYADYHTVNFGNLPDGSRLPLKKYFSNAQFDPVARVFTADVDWAPTGCPRGDMLWKYRMEFAEDYQGITGGCMMRFREAAPPVGHIAVDTEAVLEEACLQRVPYVPAPTQQGLCYVRDEHVPLTSIMGGTYVQADELGLASYHFDAADDCYISYASHLCDENSWQLDDGTRPPARKPFVNPHYDPDTRTFTGDIVWEPSWDGCRMWRYRMVFSEDFVRIEDGGVEYFNVSEEAANPAQYSHFGTWHLAEARKQPLLYYRHYSTNLDHGAENMATH